MAKSKAVQSVVPVTNYKERVSAQYQAVCAKTGEFFREVVKFGALLNEIEGFLGESRGGDHDKEGLKGWLETNCPEVNYWTAQGYKSMAAKCAKMIGGGTQAIACLQGREEVIEPASQEVVEVDAEFLEKRDALFEEVDSRRKLEQMWMEFMGPQKNKGGRPKAKQTDFTMPTPEDAAKVIWNNITLMMERGDAVHAIEDMPPAFAEKYAEVLERFAKRLRKRSRED